MDNSKLKFRNATDEDIVAIHEIYSNSVENETASWEYIAPDYNEMVRRFCEITQNQYPYLVAQIGNDIAGYAYASSYRARIGYRFCVENSIYIAPSFQGSGIGRALLSELINQCARLGFKQMIAVIGDSENKASQKLHERCGFQYAGKLRNIGYKFDKWLDSILMQREL